MEDLRSRFARFGTLQAQASDAWQGPFPLPPVLATFYAQVGPYGTIVSAERGPSGVTVPGLEVWLPPLQRLWEHQAGYRWDGNSGERIGDWPPQWLVIADRSADPLILNIEDGRVLFARHGCGRWDADALVDDVPTLIAVLAAAGAVYADAGDDLYSDDDDGGIRTVHAEAALQAVAQVLGSRLRAECLLATLRD